MIFSLLSLSQDAKKTMGEVTKTNHHKGPSSTKNIIHFPLLWIFFASQNVLVMCLVTLQREGRSWKAASFQQICRRPRWKAPRLAH